MNIIFNLYSWSSNEYAIWAADYIASSTIKDNHINATSSNNSSILSTWSMAGRRPQDQECIVFDIDAIDVIKAAVSLLHPSNNTC